MAFRAHGPKVPRTFGNRLERKAARRENRAIETMVQIRRTIWEAVGAGSSSTTEARSAPLPACSDGFDNVDGGPECGVYIQMRGVEQVRIRRGLEGGGGPLGVALVAPADVGQHVGLAHGSAGALQF